MPETEKFSTYVRLSMHAALLAIAILSFRQVLASPGEFQDSLGLLANRGHVVELPSG